MAEIIQLPEDLVNKIAAGEVVERPASVVKELIDNAFDAFADTVTVTIDQGGIKKIHVVDDGVGMTREDAEMAFKPHTTSKIKTEEDLLNIKTFGFRGEALASIASVSKVTLKTRKSGADLGTEIKIEGGKVISVNEVGAPVGTSILVEDLFYNVPARKEFLKSAQTEYKAVLEIIDAYAFAEPNIGLKFIHNEKAIYNLPPKDKLEDRAREILGKDKYKKMIPLFFEHPHAEIYGFTAKPELASERKKNQYLFVNKRYVNSKSIAYAVKKAYGSLIPNNTYPPFVVFIDVPPNIVDVNVHPRKLEVKFSDEKFIFSSVQTAVKAALDRTDLTPGNETDGATNKKDPFGFGGLGGTGGLGAFGKPPAGTQQKANPFGAFGGFGKKPTGTTNSPFGSPVKSNKPKTDPFGFGSSTKTKKDPLKNTVNLKDTKKKSSLGLGDDIFGGFDSEFSDNTEPDEQPKSNTKILQIHNLYIVVEAEDGIAIYDQHALHERIIYEQLINSHKKEKEEGAIQPLMTPVVINLTASESATYEANKEAIEKAGFKVEEFGKNTYKITEVPAVLADKDLNKLFHEVLEDLESEEEIKDVDNQSNKALTYLSCRSAYKAGDSLPDEELAAMIDKLRETEIKYTCPHGRPLKIEISMKELAKLFKRTK